MRLLYSVLYLILVLIGDLVILNAPQWLLQPIVLVRGDGEITMICLLCVITKAIGRNVFVTYLCNDHSSGLVRSYHQYSEGNRCEELKDYIVCF